MIVMRKAAAPSLESESETSPPVARSRATLQADRVPRSRARKVIPMSLADVPAHAAAAGLNGRHAKSIDEPTLLQQFRSLLQSLRAIEAAAPDGAEGRERALAWWADAGNLYAEADLGDWPETDLDLCIQEGKLFVRISRGPDDHA
jgi:hypothetical protein